MSVGLTPTPVLEGALTGVSQEGERVMLLGGAHLNLSLESHVKYLDQKDEEN